MPQQTKNGKSRNSPTTWNTEYGHVIKTVDRVSDDVAAFMSDQCFFGQIYNYESCSECVRLICKQLGYDENSLKTCNEFEELLNTKQIDLDVRKRESFSDLEMMCKKINDFDNLVSKCRNTLLACIKRHILKYFVSISEQIDGMTIAVVVDCDKLYDDYKYEIDQRFTLIRNNLQYSRDLQTQFMELITNYSKYEELVNAVLVDVCGICEVIRKWVAHDQQYPEKLFDVMKETRSRNRELSKEINTLAKKIEGLQMTHTRRQRASVTIDAEYEEGRRHKHRLATSNVTVKMLISRTKDDIEGKRNEIEKSGNMSLMSSDTGASTPTLAQHDFAKLQDRLAFLKRQYRRTAHTYKNVSDRTYEHKMDVHTNKQQQADILGKIDKCNKDLSELYEQLETSRRELAAVREIRDMKLSNDTLRRIYLGRVDNIKSENPVDRACRFVAERIGKDWERLYNRLPFVPSRDGGKRERDIDTINYVAARHDQTMIDQARVSLEKWRSFSRNGSVNQLLRSLRLIEKTDLAKQVERRFGQEI